MTDELTEAVAIEQCDRDAAWPILRWLFCDDPAGYAVFEEQVNEGDMDEHFIVQAFARHRTAAIAAVRAHDAAQGYRLVKGWPWCDTCGATVYEVLCPTHAKWWSDNDPAAIAAVRAHDAANRTPVIEAIARALWIVGDSRASIGDGQDGPRWTAYAEERKPKYRKRAAELLELLAANGYRLVKGEPVAKVRVKHGGYSMELATYVAYALPEGDHWLFAAINGGE